MSTTSMRFPGTGRELLRVAVPAAIVAMAMNSGLFLVGAMAGIVPLAFAPTTGSMALAPVLLVSALGVLGGFVLYARLRTRAPEPLRTFAWTALGVLLLSFVAPLFVADAMSEIVLLNIMHVTVAAVTVFSVVMVDEDERSSP